MGRGGEGRGGKRRGEEKGKVVPPNVRDALTPLHLQPARVVRFPQTLHDGRARRAHHKRCHQFFNPIHSFSANGKMLILATEKI